MTFRFGILHAPVQVKGELVAELADYVEVEAQHIPQGSEKGGVLTRLSHAVRQIDIPGVLIGFLDLHDQHFVTDLGRGTVKEFQVVQQSLIVFSRSPCRKADWDYSWLSDLPL